MATEVLAALIAIWMFRVLPTFTKLIAVQVILAGVVEQIGTYLKGQHKTNAWVYDIYLLPEFVLLTLASYFLIPSLRRKRILFVLIPIYTIVWAYYRLSPEHPPIEPLWVTGYIIIMILYLTAIIEMTIVGRDDRPSLLIAFSLLAYFAGVVPLFSLLSYLASLDKGSVSKVTVINQGLCLVRYGAFIIACILFYRRKRKMLLS